MFVDHTTSISASVVLSMEMDVIRFYLPHSNAMDRCHTNGQLRLLEEVFNKSIVIELQFKSCRIAYINPL